MAAKALNPPLRFHADSLDRLCESAVSILGATIESLPKGDVAFNAQGRCHKLPSSDLWFCSYEVPVTLKFPEADFVRIQFQRTGVGATRVDNELIPVTASQSCISSSTAELTFERDFQQFAWRIPRNALSRKLAALTGRSVAQRLEFDHSLDLTTPRSAGLLRILDCLIDTIEAAPPDAAKLVAAELENALLVSLLCAAQHNFRDLLDRGSPAAAPWQVHRAESFIEANWDKPITVEDIVAATGASARSVFRAFKQSRGYSPMEFAKHLRLRHARRLLESADPSLSVTEIAVACGFGNLSRFSKDFSRAFGAPPSALLNRNRSTRLLRH